VETDTIVAPILPACAWADSARSAAYLSSYGGQRLDEWSFSGSPRPVEGLGCRTSTALSTDFDYVDRSSWG
jgi:hypothetical protein